ncbi:MAG TPA: DoxX family protein [Thermoanaerobaculia bacterium]|nr:DoxX family protein [Thermoanaerobaculia bacterium]
MHRILGRHADRIYAIFRIVIGFLFMCHGLQKIFGALGGQKVGEVASLIGLAGIIELVCGFLVMVGLFASWAAFLASGTMAVAYFMAHFPRGFWPILNEGELAVAYCFTFLYIAARGAGPWSVARAARNPGLE